jgi:hypothetical protein
MGPAAHSAQIASVSRPSAGNCVAVGTYRDLGGVGQLMYPVESGGSWGQAVEVTLLANAAAGPPKARANRAVEARPGRERVPLLSRLCSVGTGALKALSRARPERPPRGFPIWPLWFVAFAFTHTRRARALLSGSGGH